MNQIGDTQFLATWWASAEDMDRLAESCKAYKRLKPALAKAKAADLNEEGKVIEQRFDGREWEDIRIHTVYGESHSPRMFE